MFNLYRMLIGDKDSKTLVGIHDTHQAACKDMKTLGFDSAWFYIIEEV